MKRPAPTRYVIRDARGEELVCPSLADLHALYRQGFLADDDLVRQERSERWVRAGSLPALRAARRGPTDVRRFALVLAAAIILALAVGLLLR